MISLLAAVVLAQATPSDDALALARQTLDAIGGEAAFRAVRQVRLSGLRSRNALEQSTRPTGPWIEDVQDLVETRWIDQGSLQEQTRSRGLSTLGSNTAEWSSGELDVARGRAVRRTARGAAPAGGAPIQSAAESLELGPERALLTALSAPDLHVGPAESLNGFAHQVLAFTWRGSPVKIFVDPVSKTPSAVELVRSRPYDVYWACWGDVDSRTDWDVWTLEPGGVRYPRLWRTVSNGQTESILLIDKIDFTTGPPPPALADQEPPRLISAVPLPPDAKLSTLAAGVRLRPGAWNLLEIDQGDATYVVEAPIASAYSAGEAESLRKRGRRLAGVITTSDSWPHIGGLREYVAAGVPIYALDLNRPILQRLLSAPHRFAPDALARRPRQAIWRTIAVRTGVGSGPNRFELIPLRTATGERQMAVWFPGRRLLYTSDLFQISVDGQVITPGTVQEMAQVVSREKLDLANVVGMHYGLTPWSQILARSLAPCASATGRLPAAGCAT